MSEIIITITLICSSKKADEIHTYFSATKCRKEMIKCMKEKSPGIGNWWANGIAIEACLDFK